LAKEKRNVSTEENKATFRRYIEEVGNQGNLELADEIFDRYYVSHQPDGSTLERGPEDVKRIQAAQHEAFPDMRVSIEDQVAEGDKVVTRVTVRGIHQGVFRGMAPTGKEVEINGIAIFRFSEGGQGSGDLGILRRGQLDAAKQRAGDEGGPKHPAGLTP
jgi:predicted ester cyclase